MESLIIYPLAALAICQIWVIYSRWRQERRQVLKERVTAMLWAAAEEADVVA